MESGHDVRLGGADVLVLEGIALEVEEHDAVVELGHDQLVAAVPDKIEISNFVIGSGPAAILEAGTSCSLCTWAR